MKPRRRSELGFERGGRIEEIRAERGDRVRAGDVVASLNVDLLKVQLKKLEAERDAALASLQELVAGPRKQTIDAAKSTVDGLDVQLQLAETILQRRNAFANSNALSRDEIDQTRAEVRRLAAARSTAQKNLEDLELGTRPEKIDSQRAVIRSLDASISAAQVELEHSFLKSPFNGRIVERHVDEGFVVSPGTPAFVLIEDEELQAHFGLPVQQVQELTPGMPLKVFVGSNEVPATLKSVVAQVNDETRTMQVICTLKPTKTGVLPGEIARLELTRSASAEGFWLKTSAVIRGNRGLWDCFVAEPNKDGVTATIRRRAIEIQHTEGDRVLVRGAISEGELVVSTAASRVVVGQKVRFEQLEDQ